MSKKVTQQEKDLLQTQYIIKDFKILIYIALIWIITMIVIYTTLNKNFKFMTVISIFFLVLTGFWKLYYGKTSQYEEMQTETSDFMDENYNSIKKELNL